MMKDSADVVNPAGREIEKLRARNEELEKLLGETQKSEKMWRERERLLRQVTDNMSDMVCMVDLQGNLLYVSPSYRETLGYDPEAVMGHSVFEGVHPEDRKPVLAAFKKAVSTKVHTRMRFRYLHAAGHYVWIDSLGNNLYNAEGELKGAVLASRDVTDGKLAEDALALRDEELDHKARHLEEVNTALNVMLRHRQEDIMALETQIVNHTRDLVLPYLEKLKNTELDAWQQAYLEVMERNLKAILSPFHKRLSSQQAKLTRKELFVANLIREGRKTVEIAQMMKITPGAVELHRNHIRTKLGLNRVKANLQSYLLSLS